MRSNLFQFLENYQSLIEEGIKQDLNDHFGPETKLKEACRYALLNGGKRFRPVITILIGSKDVLKAALAVEYFHTASLIADDLPCMDNDDERRGKPSLHKAFGESTALLASYALISAGYRLIYQSAGANTEVLLALEVATRNTGILGATGGQFLDLFPPDSSIETLKEILNKKTVTLFEIAFVFGWLFSGKEVAFLGKVKQLAIHFGMAFQIADDLDDLVQDKKREQIINLAALVGVEKAKQLFKEEYEAVLSLSKELHLDSADFLALLSVLT